MPSIETPDFPDHGSQAVAAWAAQELARLAARVEALEKAKAPKKGGGEGV